MVDQVIDAMDYAVYVYDVSHIVLDNLQFMLSGAFVPRVQRHLQPVVMCGWPLPIWMATSAVAF